jgi:DNA G:T-mismatch repair endonuclease
MTSDQRSATMKAIRSKDMKPEMLVRRLVHGMGYRYRLHNHKDDVPRGGVAYAIAVPSELCRISLPQRAGCCAYRQLRKIPIP